MRRCRSSSLQNLRFSQGAICLRETLSGSYFDCQISGSFRWPTKESIGGRYIGEPNDHCNVRSSLSLLMMLYSSGFVGRLQWAVVVGATGTCMSSTCMRTSPFVLLLPDTLLRAIGNRAHAFHTLSFFASQSVLVSTLGCVPRPSRLASFSDGALGAHLSMIIFKDFHYDYYWRVVGSYDVSHRYYQPDCVGMFLDPLGQPSSRSNPWYLKSSKTLLASGFQKGNSLPW